MNAFMTFYHFPCHTLYLGSLPRTVTFDTIRTFEHHFDCLITENMQHKGSKQVLSHCSHWCYLPFFPRDAVRKLDICCRPVSVCPSVCHVGESYPADGWRYRQISLSA